MSGLFAFIWNMVNDIEVQSMLLSIPLLNVGLSSYLKSKERSLRKT